MHAITERFSDRVADYIKYRPSYPKALMDYLHEQNAIRPTATIADIGAGTGIFSQLLLDYGHTVYAVEPNDAMRQGAEQLLGGQPNYHSIKGTAEATMLADGEMDCITMAQAYHWVDRVAALTEFQRILKPAGMVILVWNNRRCDTPFLQAYEALMQDYATDYNEINHQNLTAEDLQTCFLSPFTKQTVNNTQLFDFEGLLGRVLSSSYCPPQTSEAFALLAAGLQAAFERYEQHGVIAFDYDAEVYWGQVKR